MRWPSSGKEGDDGNDDENAREPQIPNTPIYLVRGDGSIPVRASRPACYPPARLPAYVRLAFRLAWGVSPHERTNACAEELEYRAWHVLYGVLFTF